jgi:integrase
LRELQDYIREKGNSAKTTNSAISALRVIFDYLMDEEEIATNPCYGLKHLVASEEKEERGAFKLQQVQTAFKLEWEDNRDYLLSILGASCGLRNSEINALRVSSIVEKNGYHYLDVRNAYNADTKTKTPAGKRTIPLHPEVTKALQAHIKIMGYKDDEYLFWETRRGSLQPLPPKVFGDSVVCAAKLMGISDKYLNDNNITFYGWRHFFNSLLVTANINPYRVKMLMGHTLDKHNDMTGNYFKQIADDTDEIIEAVGLLFKP